MDVLAAIKEVENYFKDNWTATPIEWPNNKPVKRTSDFVRFSARVEDYGGSINGTWRRYFGLVWAQVLIPKGNSSWDAWEHAQNISDLLADKNVSTIKLMTAQFREIGIVGDALDIDAGWYRIDVLVQFLFENNV